MEFNEYTRYNHKDSIYGPDAEFICQSGKMRRLTNDRLDLPKDFAEIVVGDANDWKEYELLK